MRTRRAAVYLAVLMAGLIVATLAISAVEATRWYSHELSSENDSRMAEMSADSAFELAIGRINSDSSWRTSHTNNLDVVPFSFGSWLISYRVWDNDGDLSDNELDDCELIVTAEVNGATYSWQATLEPIGEPLECLQYAAAADDEVRVRDWSVVAADHSIVGNSHIHVDYEGDLTANCYTAGDIHGSSDIHGDTSFLAQAVRMPSTASLEYYEEVGTEIDIESLPWNGSSHAIQGQLLSSTANTVTGQIDPNGVYWIDCHNEIISISNSRLMCTLLLKSPHVASSVSGSVFWEAPRPNYPILLVDGEFDLHMRRTPLRESDVGINLNPAGTPYRETEDENTSTVYPSQLRGLIYTTDNIESHDVNAEVVVFGTLLAGGELYCQGDLFVNYREVYSVDPPPGFTKSVGMRIVSGSVRRVLPP